MSSVFIAPSELNWEKFSFSSGDWFLQTLMLSHPASQRDVGVICSEPWSTYARLSFVLRRHIVFGIVIHDERGKLERDSHSNHRSSSSRLI